MKYSKYNVVIIGSGISGLYLANKLAENNNLEDGVLIVTKEELFSGSSSLAQGGIVSVIPEINPNDSIESHIKDTLIAGCGLNNINTVKFVSENSSGAIQELIRFGVEFDKNENNKLNFTLEGAHSCPRILHAKGDSTGRVIEQSLCKRLEEKQNVTLYKNTMALELLVDSENICKGVIVFNWQDGSYEAVYSSNIIIATGGIGQVYKNTTNPTASCGDGIAIAYGAGACVENMEFVQFHPTALYTKEKATTPLVSESVRGEGAKLVDIENNYFAKDYHPKADLAPRDVVSRAIFDRMEKTNSKYVNLDISSIGYDKFIKRFPTITKLCEENNVDLKSCLIPVCPAEHYFMGGIKVDINSQTSIKNLYAIGECASSGLHGANRLASNSLLECCVFAQNLSNILLKNITLPPKKNDLKINKTIEKYNFIHHSNTPDDIIEKLFQQLKTIMTNNAGIIRNQKNLEYASYSIDLIVDKIKRLNCNRTKRYYELKNAIIVAKLIVTAAINRKNSIGAHYRHDEINQNVGEKSNEIQFK